MAQETEQWLRAMISEYKECIRNWERELRELTAPKVDDSTVETQVCKAVADKLRIPVDRVTLAHSPNRLGADSLDEIELVMEAEETFGIEIPDEDAEKWRTLRDAVEYIKTAIKDQPA